MNLRRLNDKGLASFSEFLDSLTGETPLQYPEELLCDPDKTEEISPAVVIDKSEFITRFEAAEYLFSLFSQSDLTNIEYDRGLWAWLSLFYFEILCPKDSKGCRKPGEKARWIPNTSASWRYYRHLLAGPYRIYVAHIDRPERVKLVLCGPLHKPGDIVEQLASRQEIITNRDIMEAANSLYFNADTEKPKTGAANRKRSGNIRRFIDILNQFDVTWDLYSLNKADVIEMLPDEFSQFRKK